MYIYAYMTHIHTREICTGYTSTVVLQPCNAYPRYTGGINDSQDAEGHEYLGSYYSRTLEHNRDDRDTWLHRLERSNGNGNTHEP